MRESQKKSDGEGVFLPVVAYTSFGTLLRDYVAQQKKTQRRWTLSRWAGELGLAGPSMLSMILKGERKPGDELVSAICRHLRLSPKEEDYVRDLIELERAGGNDRMLGLVKERLARHRPSAPFQRVSREKFFAVSRWQYYAIREMVSLSGFKEDADWIASRLEFRITPAQVKDAIRTLLGVGLLARDAGGKLVQTGGHVETAQDVADEGIKRYHEQSLENARESVRKHAPEIREFYGTTFVMRRSKLPQAKELIRNFHREFCKLLEDEGGDDVYQLEIGFFPVARGEIR